MQTTQDAPAEMLFKLWPWLEANRNKIIGLVVAIILIAGVYSFMASQREKRETDAGAALTELLMTPPAGLNPGDALAKFSVQYAGTAAAQRAQLQAAAAFFTTARYDDAAAQFQKFLDANPDSPLSAIAELGLAACLESQGKLDPAATAYERVAARYAGSPSALPALCGLGRIAETQGRLKDAIDRYESVARAGAMGGSLAQEAGMRAAELSTQLAAAAPKPATTTPAAPAGFPTFK